MTNGLTSFDWSVIVVYLILSLGVGLWYARQGNQGFLEFILSGRKLSWWLAGTSVVATTFSVDTPLYVTELVRAQGISGNWQWWCMGIGGTMGVLAVTFFAARWRRAEITTEVEFVELRYGGASAAFLRGFKAIFFALVKNSLNLAALFLAMSTVLEVNVGLDAGWSLWLAVGIAFFYTIFGGLWGVVLTDFFQFVVALVGSVALAFFALDGIGGIEGLHAGLDSAGKSSTLSLFPDGKGTLTPILFGVYLLLTWWANPNADGGGMFVQRMAACRDERHAVAGSLWAILAHYALRSWPWILAALVSLVVFPTIAGSPDPELDRKAYPLLVNRFLPPGWKGLLVVSFLAAFMSTISTQLNWGASVLVNDFYKRFLARERSDRHYVRAVQAATVLLMLLALPLTSLFGGVRGIVEQILGLGAGFGPALLVRWFWWRANAWTEVAAIAASTAATAIFLFVPGAREWAAGLLGGEGRDYQTAGQFLVTFLFSTLLWLFVTLLTPPAPQEQLERFAKKVRPIGWWGRYLVKGESSWTRELRLWICGVLFLFASLFAVGKLCLGEWVPGLVLAVAAGGFGVWFFRRIDLRGRNFSNTRKLW